MTLNRVLCVDDEPQVLSGLERALRKLCPVVTRPGGNAALTLLRGDRSFSVIISDMRMPEMDGAQFLSEARLLAPDAVRILLTGEADLDGVIAAVNSGHIHRYLRKPVEREELHRVVERGFMQFAATKEARERAATSLRGAAWFSVELMRPQQPALVARIERSALIALKLAERLDLAALHAVEVVTMVSMLGQQLPRAVLERSITGLLGTADEFEGIRVAVGELLDDVPAARCSITALVVKAAVVVSELEARHLSAAEVTELLSRSLDARIFEALTSLGLPHSSQTLAA